MTLNGGIDDLFKNDMNIEYLQDKSMYFVR